MAPSRAELIASLRNSEDLSGRGMSTLSYSLWCERAYSEASARTGLTTPLSLLFSLSDSNARRIASGFLSTLSTEQRRPFAMMNEKVPRPANMLRILSPSRTSEATLNRSVESLGEKYTDLTSTRNLQALSRYSVSYFSTPATNSSFLVLYSPETSETCENTVETFFILSMICSPISAALDSRDSGILIIAMSPITSNADESSRSSSSFNTPLSASLSIGNSNRSS